MLGEFQGARQSFVMGAAGYTDSRAMGTGGYIDNLDGAVAFVMSFILLEYGVLRLKSRGEVTYDWKNSARPPRSASIYSTACWRR